MHVLAIEPYYGGSHRQFLDDLIEQSRHRWSVVTLPARHWKWRMRSAPLALLPPLKALMDTSDQRFDAVLCSDMLDLPTWLGLTTKAFPALSRIPVVTYFHENQWAYPKAPDARADHHYAYTNLLTAIASDECWFNSRYNRDSFLKGSSDFLKRMPDCRPVHSVKSIECKSHVIAPGFRIRSDKERVVSDDSNRPLRIGWVGRFEHDKRPDRFLDILRKLKAKDFGFELILLGQRGRACHNLAAIEDEFPNHIVYNRFAETRLQYEACLKEMDVVVSTADHEFFGIAICEAIACGALPVTPNGLSYVEYVPESLRFDDTDEAAQIIVRLEPDKIDVIQQECRQNIREYRMERSVQVIDDRIETHLVKREWTWPTDS